MILHHGHVLVGRGVEDRLGPKPRKQAGGAVRMGDVVHHRVPHHVREARRDAAVDLKQRVL